MSLADAVTCADGSGRSFNVALADSPVERVMRISSFLVGRRGAHGSPTPAEHSKKYHESVRSTFTKKVIFVTNILD
jgi:hypothetical protein